MTSIFTNNYQSVGSSSDTQSGFSLVELMISLTIGMILLTGVSLLILQQSRARTELAKSSRQIENGRYAMQLLHDDIEHAGFYGNYMPTLSTTYLVDGAAGLGTCPDSVTAPTNLGWIAANTPTLPVAIFGYAGAAASPACVTNRKPGTAILVVRRVATATIAPAAAVANTTYLQVSSCDYDSAGTPFVLDRSGGFTLGLKTCAAASAGTALLREYIVRIYYISTCNVPAAAAPANGITCNAAADGGTPIPTLKMVEFTKGTQTVIPLVEGIEDIQFDYGIDSTGNGSPDSYKVPTTVAATTLTDTEWRNVVAVRVNLLARNTEPTTGYVDSKTYTLGLAGAVDQCATNPFSGAANTAAEVAACRAYPRHVYSEVTRAENISGRREQP